MDTGCPKGFRDTGIRQIPFTHRKEENSPHCQTSKGFSHLAHEGSFDVPIWHAKRAQA